MAVEAIVAALTEQHRELDGALAGLADGDWRRPSRCPGWTIADVVLHLALTDELVVASGAGRLADAAPEWMNRSGTVDATAGEEVERARGASGPEVHERWRAAARGVREMFAAADPSTRMRWVVGLLPARTLATTRLAEAWLHTGDVLRPLGIEQPATGRLWHIARLAWRTLPYAFTEHGGRPLAGPVAVLLTAPDGDTWEFGTDQPAVTTIRGSALDFCLVAGQRLDHAASDLSASGPDADTALRLLRTFA